LELRKAACEGGPVFDRARQAVLNVFYNVDLIKVTVAAMVSHPRN